jgi:5-methylcytosine-specific restriction endonuclease McrBC GTP-binding regulatory subunit McrB
MELIDRIFYRKINPSDFKKLYDIDKPDGGGGQTYLEAAGISNEDIIDFLECAEISDSPLPEESRSIYTFNTYVLGQNPSQHDFIEFAPRGGRNNYRISRQNMKYKHPAWRIENGFPEPNKDADDAYTSAGNFDGIIDNLVIIILRTTYRKYYAGYINTSNIPDSWPQGIGLEKLFEGERRGVLNLSLVSVQFNNSLSNPFGHHEEVERVEGGVNTLLYGVPGAGKSWTIEHEYCEDESRMERLVFHPDYTYSDFVGQILPNAEGDRVTYEFTAGPFTKLLKKAYWNPETEYFLIIEEINRGNAPAIFGEIFQLLDRNNNGTSEYGITNEDIALVVYKNPNQKVRIPSNMSIIGTMNTSDQNVFTLDTAFQRRWNMRMIENTFEGHDYADKPILDTDVTWQRFCEVINNEIVTKNIRMTSSEDKRIGAYFIKKDDLDFVPIDQNDSPQKKTKARLHNYRFAEKVLKYLWDDAFKFSREDIFKNDKYKSLEEVVNHFNSRDSAKAVKDDRLDVFKQEIVDAFHAQKTGNNTNE